MPQCSAKKGKATTDVWASMNLDQYIRPEVVAKRKATGEMMDECYNQITPYVNSTEMPFWMVPKIQALGINGC